MRSLGPERSPHPRFARPLPEGEVGLGAATYQHHRQILGAPMGNWQDFLNVSRLVFFNGQLVLDVNAVYPLEWIAEAEDALEVRQHFGQIVVSIT